MGYMQVQSVCERISCMCMPARRRALLVEPSALPPNIALLALEDNQSNAKALEPTVLRKTGTVITVRRFMRGSSTRTGVIHSQ
jgi:hypothetical protein